MSIINPAASGQSAAATANDNATPAPQQFGEEYNSFLKLLTAQVRNQDPLSPLDSTQFVEQLATFSSLEQQVKSNTSLDSIASLIGDLHSMLASDWLGQTVAVESSWVPYSGDAVQFNINAPDEADQAILNIRNSAGEEVWAEELDLETETHGWDGRTLSGIPATEQELFEFGIDLYSSGQYIGTVAPQVITTVTDIGNEQGALRLGTSSHLTTDLSKVRKVVQ